MRIGYSFWGFLGDYKEDAQGNELSTPDGNAAYGLYLIDGMIRAGHRVIMLQEDRDWDVFKRRGKYDFWAFSQERRFNAYLEIERANSGQVQPILGAARFPDLDLLVLEWRFPIPGRNTAADREKPGYQPDLARQTELLRHYTSCPRDRRPKIVIWDLDYKITEADERMLAEIGVRAIIETSTAPRSVIIPRIRVEPPVATADLLQMSPKKLDPGKKLVYVGSRYERDDVIDEWIKPVSDRFPGEVYFYGNWEKTLEECQSRWPNVRYHRRISMKDFYDAYGSAVAVPLLAKRSYLETGFVTPRIWEALIFGSLPVGLGSHLGIDQYLPPSLVARDARDMGDIVERLARMGEREREELRQEVARKICFMDESRFIKTLEEIVQGKG